MAGATGSIALLRQRSPVSHLPCPAAAPQFLLTRTLHWIYSPALVVARPRRDSTLLYFAGWVQTVASSESFVDIHCHMLPDIDDGAKTWEESLAMARMAAADGIEAVVVTPHQLGAYAHNGGSEIRRRTARLQKVLDDQGVELHVRPGADVRIEGGMIEALRAGDVLTLGDHGRHVLLELPHELYFPLEEVLHQLDVAGMCGILSHPERNQGLLKQSRIVPSLVDRGCLMQVTAGSLLGTFGPASKCMAEWMVQQGLAHFLASDAHSSRARRPLMRRAFERAAELAGYEWAHQICCDNPAAVFQGRDIVASCRPESSRRWNKWRFWRKAA
jgi:protein-tyrosine phosphatase